MSNSNQKNEDARCNHLHQICLQAEQLMAGGASVKQAVSKMRSHRRSEMFKHGRLSRSRLTSLFYLWRRQRLPLVFRRNYKPGVSRVPLALIEEFLNRLVTDRVVPAATVMQSLRADWKMGRSVPGLGTWKEYWRQQYGESSIRATPPAFPVSASTLYACLSATTPAAYQERIGAALRAQRELNRFLYFVETRRNAITTLRSHEPLGNFPRSQINPQPTLET